MNQPTHPQIKSRRQHIRLWFEFYKLCLKQPKFSENLKKSENFYKPWGDVSEIKFDDWWISKKDLFGPIRVEEISKISKHPNGLNLTVPLNQPVSEVIKEVKNLIENKQTDLLLKRGIDPNSLKSKSLGFGKYELTSGEIRGRTINEILVMYQIWTSLNRPPVNTDYCMNVVETLKNRPRSNWTPYLLQIDPEPDKKGNLRYTDGQLRQVRRYLKQGDDICKSVSLGKFPGSSRLS